MTAARAPYLTPGTALTGLNTDSTLGRLRVSCSTTFRMNGGTIDTGTGIPSVATVNRLYT